jgi:hypothetical protein
VGTAASLLSFNLDADLDVWAIYFMGAYGLGMMAFWGSGGRQAPDGLELGPADCCPDHRRAGL